MNSESSPKSHPLSHPSFSSVYCLVTQLNCTQVKCMQDSLWLIYLWTALHFRMSLQCNENEKECKSDGLIASSSCCSSWRFKSRILDKNLKVLRKVTYAYLEKRFWGRGNSQWRDLQLLHELWIKRTFFVCVNWKGSEAKRRMVQKHPKPNKLESKQKQYLAEKSY